MAVPATLLSLCDGYGGTELALRSVAPVRTVCRVERDAYAAAILVERMEQARLDSCPIWDDLVTFDGSPWRGRVDIVAAGFPCQPFSAAGARQGVDDDRWLWPDIARIIRDVAPRYVLLENVGQLVAHGLPEVLYDLAVYGFDAEWGLYAASAVGAPHRRERIWIVAVADVGDAGGEGCREHVGITPRAESEDRGWGQPDSGHVVDGASQDVADADRGGLKTFGRQGTRHERDTDRCDSEDVADASGVDEREPHHQERTIARRDARPYACWGCFPPRPDDHTGWADWIAQGGPQPVLRRRTDGPPLGLADSLHLGGNGLVPQCAAEAWGQLLERART